MHGHLKFLCTYVIWILNINRLLFCNESFTLFLLSQFYSPLLSKYIQLCFVSIFVKLTLFYLYIYISIKLQIILKIDGFFTSNLEDFLYQYQWIVCVVLFLSKEILFYDRKQADHKITWGLGGGFKFCLLIILPSWFYHKNGEHIKK